MSTVTHLCSALQALARVPAHTDADKATRAVIEYRLHQALASLGAAVPAGPARPPAGRRRAEPGRAGAGVAA